MLLGGFGRECSLLTPAVVGWVHVTREVSWADLRPVIDSNRVPCAAGEYFLSSSPTVVVTESEYQSGGYHFHFPPTGAAVKNHMGPWAMACTTNEGDQKHSEQHLHADGK